MERPLDLLSFDGLSCISFNEDFSQCAVSHKDKYLYIYQVTSIEDSSNWTLLHTLKSVLF